MIGGVILAGGRARRIGGGDKGLLVVGGQPIVARVVERLQPQVAALALNANGDPARFAAFGLPVLPDDVADFPGPLAGILAGMEWGARIGAEAVVTAACDTPFPPCDLVARLREAAARAGAPVAVAAAPDGSHPTFGLWSVHLRDDLRAALRQGVRRVSRWAADNGAAVAAFPDSAAFLNVNTPEDLTVAERIAAGG